MLVEILLFLFLGFCAGAAFGILPGIHPNMIVLLVPFMGFLGIPLLPLLAFVVSMSVSNAIMSFVPSILLGAPEPGNEMSVLPGHKMLLSGHGYDAVKLSVIGALGAGVFTVILMPALFLSVPPLYGLIRPFIHFLLMGFSLIIVMTENTLKKRALAVFVFLFSGAVGLASLNLPMDNILLLFPILSGFFGISTLVLQINKKSSIPKQSKKEIYVSQKTLSGSVVKGSLGGVLAGFLPGVGSSQIAAVMSRDKNEKSFLVAIGAISVANIFLSILSLWLIGRPRSGAAVVVDQLFTIGFNEVLFIAAVSVLCTGLSVVLTLLVAKKCLALLEKINYSRCSAAIICFIAVLTFAFTGFFGILLLATTAAFGVFVNLANIKRGTMMGVLILPTILFYAGF